MKTTKFIFLFIFALQACYDIFKEDEIEISNTLSLINQNSKEATGYILIESDTQGVGFTLVDCYVTDLWQNDTLILVKCVDRESCEEKFYRIKMVENQKKHQVVEIGHDFFTEILNSLKFDNELSNLDFRCP